jgi:DNA polymerase-3 subunit delta
LWAITRELRLIYRIKAELAAGTGTEAVYARHRVWDSRKAAVEMALGRLNRDSLQRGLLLSGRVDRIIKGMEPGDEWDALLTLCNSLTTPQGRSLIPFRA